MSASSERIYLVGMPGSGKSTMGKGLAQMLGWQFIDTDVLLEQMSGSTISVLFQQGEARFRSLESLALQEAARHRQAVIATGGGMVIDPGNLALMKSTGLVVWINTDLEEIVRRCMAEQAKRPMLLGLSEAETAAKLSELLEQRRGFYQNAQVEISGSSALEELYLIVNQ